MIERPALRAVAAMIDEHAALYQLSPGDNKTGKRKHCR